MNKFLTLKHGSQDGRTWAVAAPIDGSETVSDRRIMSLRSLADPDAVAPEPASGQILAGYMVRNPAHQGKDRDGSIREFADSYTLYVDAPTAAK